MSGQPKHTTTEDIKKAKFCNSCGEKLLIDDESRHTGYDTVTGKKLTHTTVWKKCPNRSNREYDPHYMEWYEKRRKK